MLRFEPVVREFNPDWVIVVGDVNSSLASSLVCSKLAIKVAHVEAGLRSFDRTMPEEINRVLTDQIADLLFTPSADANQNLLAEGIPKEKIHFVGNVMIDTLANLLPKAQARFSSLREGYDLDKYLLVTLHRPSNVDDPQVLREFLEALKQISSTIRILFPVHPRTRQRIEEFGFGAISRSIDLLEPFGYLDFLALQAHAALVLTDSGGIQEETTYLNVPCLTARTNTERPATIQAGTNQLVESRAVALVRAIRERLEEKSRPYSIPPLWDGRAAQRIVSVFRGIATN
jgi:UDP-N-acetylglucosamine 2-epimerase (non-hydrolysing)